MSAAGLVRSEESKMLAGELYDGNDPALVAQRQRTRDLCQRLNALPAGSEAERAQLLNQLFGRPVKAQVTPPFFCDYGQHIELGDNAYFNFNCVILDVCLVRIGRNALFGPGVHIYTATHPLSAARRRAGLESGAPVSIGDDVWVGGGAIICPGVTIGSGAVIGAGSVVTRDVPPGVFAAGNPCRVLQDINDEDAP